ncbi:MAG: cell division protein FtsL [Rhodobacteraceae bacterium]|nr:cell division protein FtsL [Paracoccaceae bacterium]
MRTILYLLAALATIALAYWAYNENNATREALRQVRELQRDIGTERETLSVLKAEWAYLNRPERLRELSDLNFDTLQLMPLAPEHFGNVDQVAFPELRVEEVTGPVDLSAPFDGVAAETPENADAPIGGQP